MQECVLGQSLDLISEHKQISLSELELIHRNKTGALLIAALKLGSFVLTFYRQRLEQSLTQYAEAISF